MFGYYFWEVAITGIFDNLFLAFCITCFYFLSKWDRYRMKEEILTKMRGYKIRKRYPSEGGLSSEKDD
tara:strand:- start:56 stop:259 length:204 start_codon:yes stop_codon:yes gene_type:complete